MKIQMPVKLPRPSMRHQPLLDPIDREARVASPDKYSSYTRLSKNMPIANRPQTPSGSP